MKAWLYELEGVRAQSRANELSSYALKVTKQPQIQKTVDMSIKHWLKYVKKNDIIVAYNHLEISNDMVDLVTTINDIVQAGASICFAEREICITPELPIDIVCGLILQLKGRNRGRLPRKRKLDDSIKELKHYISLGLNDSDIADILKTTKRTVRSYIKLKGLREVA